MPHRQAHCSSAVSFSVLPKCKKIGEKAATCWAINFCASKGYSGTSETNQFINPKVIAK